ncbi:MAG TPA: hypothetical protein VG937_16665 [Polyangiaceae bacterium]|nr:hypothetical protein [Polyangiaceae bacterium]
MPAIRAASRTVWSFGRLVNTSDYCSADSAYNYGSGIDNFDNAKNTVVDSNQIRKGQNGLSVAQIVREPDSRDSVSLPFHRSGNLAVAELTRVPTTASGAAGAPALE